MRMRALIIRERDVTIAATISKPPFTAAGHDDAREIDFISWR